MAERIFGLYSAEVGDARRYVLKLPADQYRPKVRPSPESVKPPKGPHSARGLAH